MFYERINNLSKNLEKEKLKTFCLQAHTWKKIKLPWLRCLRKIRKFCFDEPLTSDDDDVRNTVKSLFLNEFSCVDHARGSISNKIKERLKV